MSNSFSKLAVVTIVTGISVILTKKLVNHFQKNKIISEFNEIINNTLKPQQELQMTEINKDQEFVAKESTDN
jgi:hypothetical protein